MKTFLKAYFITFRLTLDIKFDLVSTKNFNIRIKHDSIFFLKKQFTWWSPTELASHYKTKLTKMVPVWFDIQ